VNADFQITWVHDSEAGLGYFAIPANSWNCQGIAEARFGGVDEVQGETDGNVPIFWHVEPGLCGFADSMDFYIYEGNGLFWAMYIHDGNGQQIGTCYPNTTTLGCEIYSADSVAYCQEDFIC
jgi:hypothetical protein